LGEGARVTVLIRPDAVLVAERGVPAVVNRVRMVGPEMILDLVTVGPEPLTLRARLRLDARPRTGETVNLALHPVRTLVIPA
jgi:ABC-type sugar transport system ATPase subunit